MATWFYYDNDGQKQGPYNGGQFKELAKLGTITPDTVVETEDGKSAPARRVKGLTFAETAPSTPTPPTTEWYYYDENGCRQGTVTGEQLKDLAKIGIITPETIVERSDGMSAKAGQVKGLFKSLPETESASSSAIDELASSAIQAPQPAPVPETPPQTGPRQFFCTNCGNPVARNAVACTSCGMHPTRYKKFCQQCGKAHDSKLLLCHQCGENIANAIRNDNDSAVKPAETGTRIVAPSPFTAAPSVSNNAFNTVMSDTTATSPHIAVKPKDPSAPEHQLEGIGGNVLEVYGDKVIGIGGADTCYAPNSFVRYSMRKGREAFAVERKSKITPSQAERDRRRAAKPAGNIGEFYDQSSYRKGILVGSTPPKNPSSVKKPRKIGTKRGGN